MKNTHTQIQWPVSCLCSLMWLLLATCNLLQVTLGDEFVRGEKIESHWANKQRQFKGLEGSLAWITKHITERRGFLYQAVVGKWSGDEDTATVWVKWNISDFQCLSMCLIACLKSLTASWGPLMRPLIKAFPLLDQTFTFVPEKRHTRHTTFFVFNFPSPSFPGPFLPRQCNPFDTAKGRASKSLKYKY